MQKFVSERLPGESRCESPDWGVYPHSSWRLSRQEPPVAVGTPPLPLLLGLMTIFSLSSFFIIRFLVNLKDCMPVKTRQQSRDV